MKYNGNSLQLNVLLRLTLRNLVLNNVDRREKQQRDFRAAAHHQRRIVHLHAVINPHAGRHNAQKTEQQGQTVRALVFIQQKHEYHAPENRQRRGRVRDHLQCRIRCSCVCGVHLSERLPLIGFNCL